MADRTHAAPPSRCSASEDDAARSGNDTGGAPTRALATAAAADALRVIWPEAEVTVLDLARGAPSAAARAELGMHVAAVVMPEEVAQARAFLGSCGLDHLPVIAWEGSPGALLSALAARMRAVQADAGLARRSAALLRMELDQVQTRFHALESFAYSLGGPRISLALDWPAQGITARGEGGPGRVGADAPGGRISQALPLDVSSIAAVELWLPEADAAEAATLTVSLLDSEGLATAFALDTASAAAGGGWLRFTGAPAAAREAQDCTLIIEGTVEDVAFGLSMPVPDPAFRVQGVADPDDRVLALRVWRAVPPLTLPALVGRASSADQKARRMMPSEMPRPSLLAAPSGASDYITASFWPREDAILVHPSARGPVCAVVQRLALPLPRHVSAVVNAARGDSPVLGFAIGCLPAGSLSETDWQRHLGAWTYLAGGSWGEVHAFNEASHGSSCDLILATCVAGAASNDNAWALFRAFRFAWDAH